MIDWNAIDTVLLDMDGTLLDLHFDNHFWQEHVPVRYAERHGLPHAEARSRLTDIYRAKAGTLDWYCVDYWTRELQLDIARLKEEVAHLIAVHPDVPRFLDALRAARQRRRPGHQRPPQELPEDGAHRAAVHFDLLITSHEVGLPRRDPAFWLACAAVLPYDPARTLLIDDSLPVLRSARQAGIAHLLAVYLPDTRQPEKDVGEFAALRHFAEIMPVFSPAPRWRATLPTLSWLVRIDELRLRSDSRQRSCQPQRGILLLRFHRFADLVQHDRSFQTCG
jgi:putative hydrolase of the HAD superfamily